MSDHERTARELFEAARRAAPAPELAQQILERARHEREPALPAPMVDRRRRTVAAGFILAALAAGMALVMWAKPEPLERSPIVAEPRIPSARLPERQQPPATPPSIASGLVAPERQRALPPSAPKRPELARSLPEQLGLLKQARNALRAGAATSALAILDTYQRGTNSVDMSAEATLLRIEALVQLGRRAEANELVERFVAQHSDNPLVDRARSLASGRTEAVGMGRENRHEPKQEQ